MHIQPARSVTGVTVMYREPLGRTATLEATDTPNHELGSFSVCYLLLILEILCNFQCRSLVNFSFGLLLESDFFL